MATPTSGSRVLTTPRSTPSKPVALVDSPGTWKHPRLNEIARRQEQATFNEENARRLGFGILVLAGMVAAQVVITRLVHPQIFPAQIRIYISWAWFAAKLLPVLIALHALKPFYWKRDDLSDIPLTAAQRQLLNLPPSPRPAAPTGPISTPPRYSRTPSMSGSVGSRASFASSPLSGRGSPVPGGSPFSPAGRPLAQESFATANGGNRKLSFGSPGGLGASTATSLLGDPSSPSPSAGKRTSVSLNSKWLYEKGRRSSGGAWMH